VLVVLDNSYFTVKGAPRALIRLLDRRTAYREKGYRFTGRGRGGWDGRVHFVKARRKSSTVRVPVGFLSEFMELLDERGLSVEILDARRHPRDRSIVTAWNIAFQLYDYQQEAVDAVVEPAGPLAGKLLLKIPTRGGKTVIAAAIIHGLGKPALFIVPSAMLLHQTVAAFRDILGIQPGEIGGGVWRVGDVTVALIQSLAKHMVKGPKANSPWGPDDKLQKLIDRVDVVFFDEVHHLTGDKWRRTFQAFDTFYKIGLSATIYFDMDDEIPTSSIMLRAFVGPIVYERDPSYLITRGFLIQPTIRLVEVRKPQVTGVGWQRAYDLAVVRNEHRNRLIVAKAKLSVAEGMATLVTTSKSLEHIATLDELLRKAKLTVGVITGATPADERARIVEDFKARRLDVLLGTVLGEGVNIPEIECVINAEAGADQKRTMQRFRNLTTAPGKTRAVFYDFIDLTNHYLAKHALARVRTYRSNAMFNIEVERDD
jgi:superfamily II DNA or RNA helicase